MDQTDDLSRAESRFCGEMERRERRDRRERMGRRIMKDAGAWEQDIVSF